MASFIDDLTAKVQAFNAQVAQDVTSLKNLAQASGVKLSSPAPATPTAPSATPANAVLVGGFTATQLAIGVGLLALAVFVWKKI